MPVEIKNLNINVKTNCDKQETAQDKDDPKKTVSNKELIEAINAALKNHKER